MRGILTMPVVLTWTVVLASGGISNGTLPRQRASGVGTEPALAKDVYPDSRNRLPAIKRDDLAERGKKAYDEAVSGTRSPRIPQGAAAIRLHGAGVKDRYAAPVGRPLS